MNKYKLIKTYPGSPELGTVVDENSPHNLYQLCINEPEFWEKVLTKEEIMQECIKRFPKGSIVKCARYGTIHKIAKEFVTPGEKDWFEGVYYYGYSSVHNSILAIIENEKKGFYLYHDKYAELIELPEKEYEILSIRYQYNNCIYMWDGKEFRYLLGVIELDTVLKGYVGPYEKGNEIYIHSVKRLSDGEIFSIGDEINNSESSKLLNTKIKSFCLNDIYMVKTTSGTQKLESLEHRKQPIFKTEDGVEIFEGDIVVPVNLDTLKTHAITPIKTGESLKYGNYKHFSTKEKAENYILFNKPCLSIKEIASIPGRWNNPTCVDLVSLTEKLKELVKPKL
jgi:hypothetical protein